jgi:hypothetical protein
VEPTLVDGELPRAACSDLFAADLLRAPLGLAAVVPPVLGGVLDHGSEEALLLGLGHSATAQAVSAGAAGVTFTAHDPSFAEPLGPGAWPLVVAGLGRFGRRALQEAALDPDRALSPDEVAALLATPDDPDRLLQELRGATDRVDPDGGVLLAAVEDRPAAIEAVSAALDADPGFRRLRIAEALPILRLRHAPGVRTPAGLPRPSDLALLGWRRL